MSSEVLAISYDVWISGTKLDVDKKECIVSIDVKQTVDGSDVATIVIYDPEYMYIEDNIFLEDNDIRIELGWTDTTYREVFEGYISAIDIDFDASGIPKLTVSCMDMTHKMNRSRKNATFSNTTSAEVVKKIVQSYGFTCVVEENYAFTKEETITQSRQTDIDFITSLASKEIYPFTARLVGNTFYYVKKGKLQTPVMELTYKAYPHEIISFSPKLNKEYKQTEISSSTLDTSTKTVESTTATVDNNKGSSGNTVKNDTTVYNPNTGTWTASKSVQVDSSSNRSKVVKSGTIISLPK